MNRNHANQSDAHCVSIGKRLVGPDQPAYVIAEAGVNHDGSLDRALRLVDVAADAGGDAVKFQVFRADELATASARTADYQREAGSESQREMLVRLELADADFERVRARCTERAIEFLATPFGPHDIDRLLRLQVRAIKIASTDLNNVPLLRRAAQTGLPLIVSTGAATADEIAAGVARLREWGLGGRLILLHCVSGYPTPLNAANLRAVGTIRAAFDVPCGFSDHTTSTQTGAWAVAAGANVLEKHFTLDRSAPGPDHAMSLDPPALREYIAAVRDVERALGSGRLGMTGLEVDVRAIARKSVVAACDLTTGTVLRPEMVTVKRPAGGIPPDQLDSVIGRQIALDVPQDTILTWDMIR
jgi:N,N'-diacetyllegionaminate synthase